jgi:hypothetical protein
VIRVVSIEGQLVEVEGRAAALVEWIAQNQNQLNGREVLTLEVHAKGRSGLNLKIVNHFNYPEKAGGSRQQ